MAAIDVPMNESEFLKSEEPLKPDPAKTVERKRLWSCLIGGGCVLAAVSAALFILCFVLQPKKPTVEFQDFTVSNFATLPGQGLNKLPTRMLNVDVTADWSPVKAPSYGFLSMTINNFTIVSGRDLNGLPTKLLYMDIVAHWFVQNKNPHVSAYFNGGVAQCGYRSLPVIAKSVYSNHFWVNASQYHNFTSHFLANGYPVDKIVPLYLKDYELGMAQLDISAVLTTHVPVLWKLVQRKFTSTITCQANFDPKSFVWINATCIQA